MGELRIGERLSLTAGPDACMSNCMAVVTGLELEYAPSVMGGEYEAANTGTLGTQGNANGLFTVYNFQVADYHTYFAAPEADKPFVWVHNAGKGYKNPQKGWKSTQAKPAGHSGPYDPKFTKANSKQLRKNMEAYSGSSMDGSEAHHIVAGTHRFAKRARALLDKFQIDTNSALNGAKLSNSLHHGRRLHSNDGMQEVFRRLNDAAGLGGGWHRQRTRIATELRRMAKEMEAGTFHIPR